MRCRAILIGLIAATTALPSLAQSTPQRGLPQDPPEFTELPMPANLRDFWQAVPLILIGRVQSVGRPRVIATGGSPLVGRIQTILALEILKSPPEIRHGATIKLLQYGGTVDIAGREVSTAYRENLLDPGQQAVLFLMPSHEGAWQVAWTRAGFLPVDQTAQAIRVPPGLALMPEFTGKKSISLIELLNQLRALKRSGGK